MSCFRLPNTGPTWKEKPYLGFSKRPCANSSNLFCEGPFGACYDPGVTGWCEPVPMDCPDLWDPVCGCDAVTYANDCERSQAGVWALHSGDCSEEPFNRTYTNITNEYLTSDSCFIDT